MKSKKILLKSCTLAYEIAKLVDTNNPKDICKILGIEKQNLTYYLNLLKKDGIIENPCWGKYNLTPSSKKFLGGLIENERKEMIRLEALRYKFPIKAGIENLKSKVKWSSINLLNVTKEYHTVFENHTARLIEGIKKIPSLELYCNQSYGYDPDQLMFEAKMEVSKIMENVSSKYSLEHEEAIQSMQPDFAIPSPLAEAVLTKMGASQVKMPEATINQSQGRKPEIEPHNLQYAHQVIQMPYNLQRLVNLVINQQTDLTSIKEHLGTMADKQVEEPKPPRAEFTAYG